MVALILFAVVALVLVVLGYRQVAEGTNSKTANGVLLMTLGVALVVSAFFNLSL